MIMLPREIRLPREFFKEVSRKGKNLRRESLMIKILRNNSGAVRVGFSISAKNLKPASLRNLLKRRAREIVRKKIDNLKKGYDILFIFSEKAGTMDFNELENEINSALFTFYEKP